MLHVIDGRQYMPCLWVSCCGVCSTMLPVAAVKPATNLAAMPLLVGLCLRFIQLCLGFGNILDGLQSNHRWAVSAAKVCWRSIEHNRRHISSGLGAVIARRSLGNGCMNASAERHQRCWPSIEPALRAQLGNSKAANSLVTSKAVQVCDF